MNKINMNKIKIDILDIFNPYFTKNIIIIIKIIYLLSILLNSLIIYYLVNLEDETCKCIYDWRHDFVKYYSIFNIVFSIIIIIFIDSLDITSISGIIALLSLFNFYAFFTYIRDLHNTNCKCAIEKQKKLHAFLNINLFDLFAIK